MDETTNEVEASAAATDEANTAGKSKAERFREIAGRRTNEACKKIQLIANCVGSSYESTAEQRDAIVNALQEQVDLVKDKFASCGKAAKKESFVNL